MALIFQSCELGGSVPSQPISQCSFGDWPLLSVWRDVYCRQNFFALRRFLGSIQAILQKRRDDVVAEQRPCFPSLFVIHLPITMVGAWQV
jgi:hypothetical protein